MYADSAIRRLPVRHERLRRPYSADHRPAAPTQHPTHVPIPYGPGRLRQALFDEIKALGYEDCLNLLHKYINQGRADADRSHISPRRLARMLLTRPDNLKAEHHDLLAKLTAACSEMTQLAAGIRDFAQLLTPRAGNTDGLSHWITQVRATDLPHLHSFTRGLESETG